MPQSRVAAAAVVAPAAVAPKAPAIAAPSLKEPPVAPPAPKPIARVLTPADLPSLWDATPPAEEEEEATPPARPAPVRPAPRPNGAVIFQMAWGSPDPSPDDAATVGPNAAAREAPLPGEEALFRRI